MSHQEAAEKKSGRRGGGGLLGLILLLLLAGTLGYLYYSVCKAPFIPDDPRKLASSAPMSAEERFLISSQDQTARIRVDKTDIWYLILQHTDLDFLDDVNKELESYDLEIAGYAIRMDEEGPRLDLELFYKDFRLLAKVPCELEISGQHFCLRPAGLKLGVIPLPVSGLLSAFELEYDHALPVLTEVTGVSYGPDAMFLTGPMEQDVRAFLPQGDKLNRALIFCEEAQPLADALFVPGGFGDVMDDLEQDPGSMEDLYRDLFTLAEPDVTEAYLEERYGLTERFFPGIDFPAVAERQKVLTKELKVLYITLEKFLTNAASEYNEYRLKIVDSVFMYGEEPFQAGLFEYRKYGPIFEILDPEAPFLIVVDVENGFIRRTPSLYRMVDENQQFTQEADFNKTYILGCVLRSVDGDPYLLYETERTEWGYYFREVTLRALTEDQVKALQEPGKVGLWTD